MNSVNSKFQTTSQRYFQRMADDLTDNINRLERRINELTGMRGNTPNEALEAELDKLNAKRNELVRDRSRYLYRIS